MFFVHLYGCVAAQAICCLGFPPRSRGFWHGGMEVSMPGHSVFPDGHKERELENLRDAPLSDMDLMK